MSELGVTESSIVQSLSGLKFVSGIRDLIETSHDRGFEIVVLSDNLTLFVEAFLESSGIRQNDFLVYRHFYILLFKIFKSRRITL